MVPEHPFIEDTREWDSSRPLLSITDDPAFLSDRLVGELGELLEHLPTIGPWAFVRDREHAVRETPDIGVFATSLWIKLTSKGVLSGDLNAFLYTLSKDPPQMSLWELRTKIVQLRTEIQRQQQIDQNFAKFLHIQEAIVVAWAAARALGRDYKTEFLLKTGYNRARYHQSELQLDGLQPHEYVPVFKQRIKAMSSYAIESGMEEKYYREHRKIPAPRTWFESVKQNNRLFRFAGSFASAVLGLIGE